MKFKRYRQKSDGAYILKVILDKKDSFNYVMAKRLSINESVSLLPFAFDENSVLPELFYDISGLTTLKTLLEAKISLAQFDLLLKQVVMMLEALNLNDLPERNIVFDPVRIFACIDDFSLRFVYLPLDSQPVNEHAVFDLLLYMAQNARFDIEADRQNTERLTDYIKRQSVFSLVDLKAFLGMGTLGGRVSNAYPLTENGHDESIALIASQAKRWVGRDFVTDASGVKTREQRFESQSVAENVLSVVRGDLVNNPPLPYTAAAMPNDMALSRHRFILIRVQDDMMWSLDAPRIILGRSFNAQLRVSESIMVSRQHAVLHLDDTSVALEDLGSNNGTYINGMRLAPRQRVRVAPGDRIMLGDQLFFLRRDERPASL